MEGSIRLTDEDRKNLLQVYRIVNALHDQLSFPMAGLRQQNDKFIPTNSGYDVVGTAFLF